MKPMPIFKTLADVVTDLLKELKKTYVTLDTRDDKIMRRKIKQASELINSNAELSKIMIKGDPYKKNSRGTDSSSEDVKSPEGGEVDDLDAFLNHMNEPAKD